MEASRKREAVKNPPDFVMYVVMVKKPLSKKFDPAWRGSDHDGRKRDALNDLRIYKQNCGKQNAYVQQYGPYS